MRSVVRDETNQHAKIVDEMSEQFKQIGLELKDLYDRKPSADELDKYKYQQERSICQTW